VKYEYFCGGHKLLELDELRDFAAVSDSECEIRPDRCPRCGYLLETMSWHQPDPRILGIQRTHWTKRPR
jgi:hypothetical protein